MTFDILWIAVTETTSKIMHKDDPFIGVIHNMCLRNGLTFAFLFFYLVLGNFSITTRHFMNIKIEIDSIILCSRNHFHLPIEHLTGLLPFFRFVCAIALISMLIRLFFLLLFCVSGWLLLDYCFRFAYNYAISIIFRLRMICGQCL